MKLWPRRRVVLHSPLPSESCVEALARAIDVERGSWLTWSGYSGVRPVVGKINVVTFRIQKRPHWFWRNAFAPNLYGEIIATPAGTEIRGFFDFYPPVGIVLRIWIAIVAAAAMVYLAGTVKQVGSFAEILDVFLVAAVFLSLPTLGRLLARPQERILLTFLESTLHARFSENSEITQ